MLSKNDFQEIRKELDEFEKKREEIIQKSRKIIQLSKQVIYAAQRDELNESEKALKEMKKELKDLGNHSFDTDLHKTALQEYVEAVCYFEFVKNERIPTSKEIGVNSEYYLLGICDLTGELVRKAVNDVINKNYDDFKKIKNLVEEIYGEFLKFNFRNGELRKKSGSIKWNLKKLEDMEYELKMRRKE